MAERKDETAGPSAAEPPGTQGRAWAPTAASKKQAMTLRWIAVALWVVAIAAEAVGIFWLLRQREYSGSADAFRRDEDTGLLSAPGVTATFPQWAFITLLVLFVVIAALSIIGSFLWKRANRLDPAKKSETVRFFVQNQLGAIIAIVAFVPLIILVFLNKDMDKGQKTTAGIVGIVLAAVAVVFGVDFAPPSVEQYTADQSTVIQLLGEDEVFWVSGGAVYHVCDSVSDIQTGSDIVDSTTAEAVAAGKSRLTLKFASELTACGLAVPENADEIADALREIQAGNVDTPLPAPVWADSSDAPQVEIETGAAPAE